MYRLFSVLALLLPLGLGCGQDAPPTAEVSGRVTFDSQPIEAGDILFLPVDKHLAPEAGKIIRGRYRMTAKVGKSRVEIRANRAGPDAETFEGQPLASNYIPTRYNTETELTAEVTASGENHFDFALESADP